MSRARPAQRRRFKSSQRSNTRRLFLESLEGRQMLTVVGALVGDTLTLTGTAGIDTLEVAAAGNMLTLTAPGDTVDLTSIAGLLDVETQTFDFSALGITKLNIDLKESADVITLDAITAATLVDLRIDDALGTDTANVDGAIDIGGPLFIGGNTNINAGIKTAGAQTYSEAVELDAGGALVLEATGNGPIVFSKTVNGTAALTVTTGGTTTFNGVVGGGVGMALTSLTADGGGTTEIKANVTTTGTQTYTDGVTLVGDTTLTGTTPTFGTVAGGGFDLTLSFTGTTAIVGANFTGIKNLTSNNGGSTTLTGALLTTGTQTYSDAVTLVGDTTLTGTTPTFSTVAGGGFDLTLSFTGPTAIVGANFTGIKNLTSDNTGSTTLAGSLTTTGTQTYTDAVTLVGDTTLTGTTPTFGTVAGGGFDLTLSFTGTTAIVGANFTGIKNLTSNNTGSTTLTGALTTTGTQTYTDGATLVGDTTLTGTTPTFSTVAGGGFDLTLSFTGPTAIVGANFTGIKNLTSNNTGSTTLTGGLTTTGTQTYTDAVTLLGDTVLTGTTPTFSTVAGGGFDLTLSFTGTTAIVGGNFTGIKNLTSNNTGSTMLTGGLTTTGTQTYTDAVTLVGDTTLTGTTPTFNTVAGGGFDLTLSFTGTTAIVGGNFTGIKNLTSNNTGSTTLTGALTTTGTQTYTDAVTLVGDTTLTGTMPTFSTVAGGGFDLTLSFTGTTVIVGGNFTGIKNLTSNNTGSTTLTGGLTTTGTQTYTDAVTLVGDTTLTGTTPTFNTVTGGGFDLTLSFSGTTAIVGANFTDIRNLTSNNGGGTTLTGALTTTGTQTYTDGVTLVGNTTLTGTTPTFSTVDGDGFDLTLSFTGTTAIVGGNFTAIKNLASNNNGSTTLSGALTTSGTQTYSDNVTLVGGTVTLTSNGAGAAGNIRFDGTLDGAAALTIATSGATIFNGLVGNAGAGLVSLTTNATGSTEINGGGAVSIRTSEDQTYNDDVTLGADTKLVGRNFLFAATGSVNSSGANRTLTIDASGTVGFLGQVGNILPLNQLTVTAEGAISAENNITTTGDVSLTAEETGGSARTNNVTVQAKVESLTGKIVLQAGDDLALIAGSTLKAVNGSVELSSVDGADDPPLAGATFDPLRSTGSIINVQGTIDVDTAANHIIKITTSGQADTINVRAKNLIANLLEITGGGNDLSRTDIIRTGDRVAPPNPAARPYFIPKMSGVTDISDLLTMDYTDIVVNNALTVVKYTLSPGSLKNDVVGSVPVALNDIEQLSIKANPGAVEVIANMADLDPVHPATKLPAIVQVFASGTNDRLQVIGVDSIVAGQEDKISIGDVGAVAALGRAQFELSNVERMWVRTFKGNDFIDNISHVPALLDGGEGNDVINNIVNNSQSRFPLQKKIANTIPVEVSLVLGKTGSDALFTGTGLIDKTMPKDALNLALQAFGDTGITFVMGDHEETKVLVKGVLTDAFKLVADGNSATAIDSYFSSAASLRHGFIKNGPKDANPLGVFLYGAGDKVKFSNTISWLKAQIFVKKAVTDLLTALAKQIAFYEAPLTASAGEAPDELFYDDSASAFSAATDVNRDGEITASDALVLINELNANGSHKVAQPIFAEGEADDEIFGTGINFDVDEDGEISPSDPLLVINALNAMAEFDAQAEEDAAEYTESDNEEDSTPDYTSHDLIMMLLSSSNSRSTGQRKLF